MKTQISRNAFKAKKRYSGVYQQQGRMLTDADWNAMVDVLKGHVAEAFKDIVGTGSPRDGALTITPDRQIQTGDLYVDGLRAELPGRDPIDASSQPDFPGSPNLPETGPYIVYADVWERSLTSLEDPDLRDAGLNGADTCTRTQTMLQIKTCPENVDPENENDMPRHGNAALTLALHGNRESGDLCDPCAGEVGAIEERMGNYLFRLEVHLFEGTAADPTRLILKWSSENGAEQYAVFDELQNEIQMPPGFVVSGRYSYEFFNLISETHLGVHLNPDPDFSPTLGELKPAYEIPDGEFVPKDYVRRWDGYCRLSHNGSVWSLVDGFDKGVPLSTTVADSAPGHVSLGSSLIVNLEALALKLALNGGTFVAGDYWLAPVREAEHGPGSRVLTGALPEGVVHHYLRLARVAADGSVQPYEDDVDDVDGADERRRSFPPLTDLRAFDVGYRADCDKGLFQNFEGTVKDALDKICEIQAKDVLFPKPCDTSIYQGQTVDTVEDVLKLLCNVQAGQIAYQPGSGCTALPGINTVQAALDALCVRPAGSGGCKVTVGDGGQFTTLEAAINTLLDQKALDICLCLLPGDHVFPGQAFKAPLAGVKLCLSGCGSCTRLYVEKAPLYFSGFEAVSLSSLEIITRDAPAGALIIENCEAVSLKDAAVFGFTAEGSLIEVRTARTATLQDLLLEASGPKSLEKPVKVLLSQAALADLFTSADRTIFEGKMSDTIKALSALNAEEKKKLSDEIEKQTGEDAELVSRERKSYFELARQLRQSPLVQEPLTAALKSVRLEAVRMRPAVALAIVDAEADWSLRDCDILGTVLFYGSAPSGPLPAPLTRTLDALIAQSAITFSGTTSTFRASGCRCTRINISQTFRSLLENAAAQQKGTIPGLFSSSTISDCTLVAENTQLASFHTQISASIFEVAGTRAAVVMGDATIYVGNQGGGETDIVNMTPPNRTERAANLGLSISA